MKLLASACLAFGLFISSCQSPADSQKAASQPDPLDISAQDSSVKPSSNFYLFANGSWLKKTEIPPAQSTWGSFSILFDSSLTRLHRILDSLSGISDAPKGSIAQQTGDFFVSAMDSAGIEKKGFLPARPELDSISAIKDKEGLLHEIAKEYAVNHAPFFNFYVNADDRNSLIYAAHFDQGGLGLPSRTIISNRFFQQKIRDAYIMYITKIFTLLGQSPAEAPKSVKSVFDLETAMAKISKSPVELRDPVANYHKTNLSSQPDLKNCWWLSGFHPIPLSASPGFTKG